ncbi:MAG: hypothetical protein ABSF26_05250 [Thermoguttaceae bacterium]|jgi:hypothetical protein
MNDFLEQLAEVEVRQPPPEFDRQLHQRLNRALLIQHLVDLLLGGMPWALAHLGRGVLGWLAFSLTGKFHDRKPGDRDAGV